MNLASADGSPLTARVAFVLPPGLSSEAQRESIDRAFAQCGIEFDTRDLPSQQFESAVLSIGETRGIYAGGGEITVVIAGLEVTAEVSDGLTPTQVAHLLRRMIEAAVSNSEAHVWTLTRDAGHPLAAANLTVTRNDEVLPFEAARSTDSRQGVTLLSSHPHFGLTPTSSARPFPSGDLRATLLPMMHLRRDGEVMIFVVPHFRGNRVGQAHLWSDGGPLAGSIVLTQSAFSTFEQWTVAHELGHVFLNRPFHDANRDPTRLMRREAHSSEATPLLTGDECRAIRRGIRSLAP